MTDYYLDPCRYCGTFCENDVTGCKSTQRDYDRYFDTCERANKIPLCFDAWLEAGKPDH